MMSALTFSKIKNLFQNFSQTDAAILSIEASSMRFEKVLPFIKLSCSIIPHAIKNRESFGWEHYGPIEFLSHFLSKFHSWQMIQD